MPPSKSLISKRSDPAVRRFRAVRDDRRSPYLFCEGMKLCGEVIEGDHTVVDVIADVEHEKQAREILRRAKVKPRINLVSRDVMAFLSDLRTPPGVIAIARRPPAPDPAVRRGFFLILHQVQLPQNVGALLRTAEASGVDEVWTTPGTADPFGPKALRGSAGSALRLPIRVDVPLGGGLRSLANASVRVLAASQAGEKDYHAVSWRGGIALVVASEGSGFSKTDLTLIHETVRVPMRGRVESLNVGAAAAVCLFEAGRQRASNSEGEGAADGA